MDGAVSETFTLADDLYAPLLRDALRFFHHQRCGGNVDAGSAESAQWARGAGHSGDAVATCSAGQSCDVGYPLDASGGWHDAGDYGKYVVNGGIAVWTLLDMYERSQLWGTRPQLFGDGTLNLGTSDGSSDLLDLARWEMEFLLGMQVPQGNPLAGMAHHKLHANDWVTAPTLPEEDSPPRHLQPPSTAATLNLAATAAQCARVWRDRDVAFAERCSIAAERAWTAALQNPSRHAPASSNVGGGPYDDQDASDELYWAAAELFVTTGEAEYAAHLRESPHFAGFRGGAVGGPFAWPSTAGLGTLTLSLVPNALTSTEVRQLREAIVAEADRYLSIEAATGYRVPLDAVYWGSNSEVTNAGMVLAFAHDLTGDARYRAGAASAVDYLLGNNPLSRSYVSGYGERAVQTVHHLTFASDIDGDFPSVPPGFVVGGPNADLDAFANPGVSTSCSPLACFAEQTGAYWFVEVAINWNASLAWLVAWLDESGQQPRSTAVGVDSGFAGFEDRIVRDPNGGDGGTGGSSGGASAGGSGGASGSSGTAGNSSGSTGSTGEAGRDDGSEPQPSSSEPGKRKRSGGGCSTAPGGAQPLGSLGPLWPLWLVGVACLAQRRRRRRSGAASGTRI